MTYTKKECAQRMMGTHITVYTKSNETVTQTQFLSVSKELKAMFTAIWEIVTFS